ncbi:AAA family ATPase [Longispora fulva]|uniref:AAA+ ATPase domain-containing protein n=1 Tax=Longispora fulva TaxID=619741 RepID=A0A8J7GQG6_9ACTN|nr:AAA family ATPase [Longispora fulva]MBG6136213.1 hypothetical protein [Longispora fulva]
MTHPASPPGMTRTGLPRLKPGELQDEIVRIMAGEPDRSFTARDINVALPGRSTGAIGQALPALVAQGRIVATSRNSYQVASASTIAPIPVPPPAPTRPPAKAGPIRRPGGGLYYPRDLAGKPDVQVLRELRTADIPVLLYGPPGTGKTSLIEAAFGAECHTLAGDGDTTVGDLLGDYVPDGGGYRFVDGPLVAAMETGGVFFLDDATLISPKTLAALYPAMDGRREITVKADGSRAVKAAPGFFVVAGHNPGVHGAILTEALASRFTMQIHVTTDYDLAVQLGVDRRLVRAARELWAKVGAHEIGWAPQLRELLGALKVQRALSLDVAVANLAGACPEEDRDVVREVLRKHLPNIADQPLTLGKQL